MSKMIHEEILGFSSELPRWQQILSASILGLTEVLKDKNVAVSIAVETLMFENKLSKEEPIKIELNFPKKGDSSQSSSTSKYKLRGIKETTNLNALSPGQDFPVAQTGLTVIYGENGVGKSGYGRLFNNVFFSRGDSFLLGNVYGPNKNVPPTASFEFSDESGQIIQLTFPRDKGHEAFKQFASFDSRSVNVHIDNQNELHVQPQGLGFFEELIKLIGEVSKNIEVRSLQINKINNFTRLFIDESSIKTGISNLSSKTDQAKLAEAANLTEKDQIRASELEKAKSLLSLSDLEKAKKKLGTAKNKISTLKSSFTSLGQYFSYEKQEQIKKSIDRYKELKDEVSKNGLDKFSDPKYSGIGSEKWQQFIKSANEFKALQHDHTTETCLYCRQNLSKEALGLLENYKKYLESTARESLIKADAWSQKTIDEINAIVIPFVQDEDSFSEWCAENQQENLDAINNFIENVISLKENLIKAVSTWSYEELKLQTLPDFDFESLEVLVNQNIADLNEEKVKNELKKINDELIVLKHKELLSKLLPEIKKYISDLVYVEEVARIRKQINRTTQITNKSTELHEKYVSNRYIEHFKHECIELKIPCPDLSPVGSKGKTRRKFSIVGEAPSKVLSEGEQRAVAMADFFTEATISEMSGLIFDDPVNSQDYKRKEQIARRLCLEAKSRQVIVLTHDLLFLNDLLNTSEELMVHTSSHWMIKHNQSETGIIYKNTLPDIEKSFIDAQIAKDRLKEARSANNPQLAIRAIKDGLGSLRSSYESFIIKDVFDGVVERFNSRIRHTEVVKVHAPKDVLQFVHDKLSLLSGYTTAHLLLDSTTLKLTPELLDCEIKEYEKFRADFRKDKKDALTAYKVEQEKKAVLEAILT